VPSQGEIEMFETNLYQKKRNTAKTGAVIEKPDVYELPDGVRKSSIIFKNKLAEIQTHKTTTIA